MSQPWIGTWDLMHHTVISCHWYLLWWCNWAGGSHHLPPISSNSGDRVHWKGKWNFYLLTDIHRFMDAHHLPPCRQRSKQAAGGWPLKQFPTALQPGEGYRVGHLDMPMSRTCPPKPLFTRCPFLTGCAPSTCSAPGQGCAQGGAGSWPSPAALGS